MKCGRERELKVYVYVYACEAVYEQSAICCCNLLFVVESNNVQLNTIKSSWRRE